MPIDLCVGRVFLTLRLKVAELDRMTFASAFDLPKEEYEFK